MKPVLIAMLMALALPVQAQDATYAVRLLAPETALAAAQAGIDAIREKIEF